MQYFRHAGAVRRNPLTSRATDAEVENEIKIWIKNSGDRFGGRSERARKAAKKKRREHCKKHQSSHLRVQRHPTPSVERSD